MPIGVCLLLLLAGACSDDDRETGGTTTTLAAEGPEEWVDVVRDINGRYFDLLRDPDPSRLGEIYADSCTCWQPYYDTIQLLVDDGEHIEGPPVAVTSVELAGNDPATGAVELTVQQVMADPWKRVDRDGTVVEELPTDTAPTCTALTLHPDGPNGDYRIHDLVTLPGCPPSSAGPLRRGV